MRSLKKNEKKMWYALFDTTSTVIDENGDETGDPIEVYKTPVEFKAVPSVGSGKVDMRVFGADITFSRTIVTNNVNLPINASSLIWIETEPQYRDDGTVDPDSADYSVSGRPLRSDNVLRIPLSARLKDADY